MTQPPDEPTELVHHDVAEQVATLTLDSPSNRNALSRQLVHELMSHLRDADRSNDVRVIVLTHTGTTFCSGADLSEAVTLGMEQGTRDLLELLRTIAGLATPVLAFARGHVRAGGIGLVGACDVALVNDHCTFAFSESLLGLAPAIVSLTTSSRLGERDAARKYLTGATFDGVEAARAGLVTQSVPEEALDASLISLIAEFKKAAPQGLSETKKLLNRSLLKRMDEDGEELVALSARLFASAEAREGMTAFRERRLPRWAQDS